MKNKSDPPLNQFNYYRCGEKLLSHCVQTDVYKIENCNYPKPIISKDIFLSMLKVRIKKQKFKELLNAYFKNKTYRWSFEGQKFKTLPNFKSETNIYDWKIVDGIPVHKLEYGYSAIIVCYHGEIYYFLFNGNAFPHGQLAPIGKEWEYGRLWTHIKNTSPIYNITLKKVA